MVYSQLFLHSDAWSDLQAVPDIDSPPSVPSSSALHSSSSKAAGNLAHGFAAFTDPEVRPSRTAQQEETVNGSVPQKLQVSLAIDPYLSESLLGDLFWPLMTSAAGLSPT